MHARFNNNEFVNEEIETFHPFGPRIFKSKLSTENLKFLQDFAEKNRDASSIGNNLAGNIKDQKRTNVGNKQLENHIIEILVPYIKEWYKLEDNQRELFLDRDIVVQDLVKKIDYDSMTLDLGIGTWFNYMKANEFNPLHAHSGELSGIVMIKVPKEISQERDNIKIESNFRCPGMLEWVHGDWGVGALRVYPVEGEIYLFDAKLKHQVYPYQSNVERITMSWNVYQSTFKTKEEINFGIK